MARMVKTLVDIPEGLKQSAKIASAELGITLKEFIIKAIEKAVMAHIKKTRSIKEKS